MVQGYITPGTRETIKIHTASCISGTQTMGRQVSANSTLIVRSIHFARTDISFMIKIPCRAGYPRSCQHASAFLKALSWKQGCSFQVLPKTTVPSDSTNTGRSACSHSIQQCCGTNYLLCNHQHSMFKNITPLRLVFFHILFP